MPNYDAAPEPEPVAPPPAPTMPPWAPPPQVATPMSMSAAEPEPQKQQPAMPALAALGSTDKFREQINAEGWDLEATPQFDVPGQTAISPASRALASLVGERGRAY